MKTTLRDNSIERRLEFMLKMFKKDLTLLDDDKIVNTYLERCGQLLRLRGVNRFHHYVIKYGTLCRKYETLKRKEAIRST